MLVTIFVTFFFVFHTHHCTPLQLNLSPYRLQQQQNTSASCFTQWFGEKGEKVSGHQLSNQSPMDYLERVEQEKHALLSLYQTIAAPYPGLISNQEGCAGQFLPQKLEMKNQKIEIVAHQMWATKNFALGVCHEKLIAYRAMVALVYCPADQVTHILKWFIPADQNDQFAELIKSLHCAS